MRYHFNVELEYTLSYRTSIVIDDATFVDVASMTEAERLQLAKELAEEAAVTKAEEEVDFSDGAWDVTTMERAD